MEELQALTRQERWSEEILNQLKIMNDKLEKLTLFEVKEDKPKKTTKKKKEEQLTIEDIKPKKGGKN